MNLLLLSNSSSDAGYLVHAMPDIRELIESLPQGAPAVFVPVSYTHLTLPTILLV